MLARLLLLAALAALSMGKSLCGAFAGTDPGDVYAWRPPELGCSAATPSRCLYLGSQLPKSVLSLRRLVVNGTLAAAALAGTLPAALADPSLNLRRLLVRDASALSGTLPPHLALEELWLNASARSGRSALSGTLPASLLSTRLSRLTIEGTALSGTVPPYVANTPRLRTLTLETNLLSGTLPIELGGLGALEELNLGAGGARKFTSRYNQLSGTISPELGGLASLRMLDLDYSLLSGTLPTALGRLQRLANLDVGTANHETVRNRLSGVLPTELGRCAGLLDLNVKNMRLSGTVPTELGGLAKLQAFKLAIADLLMVPPDARQKLRSWWGSLSGTLPDGLQENALAACTMNQLPSWIAKAIEDAS